MRRLAGGLFRGAFAQVIAVSYCVMAKDDCPLHGWTLGSELQRFYLLTGRISTFARLLCEVRKGAERTHIRCDSKVCSCCLDHHEIHIYSHCIVSRQRSMSSTCFHVISMMMLWHFMQQHAWWLVFKRAHGMTGCRDKAA